MIGAPSSVEKKQQLRDKSPKLLLWKGTGKEACKQQMSYNTHVSREASTLERQKFQLQQNEKVFSVMAGEDKRDWSGKLRRPISCSLTELSIRVPEVSCCDLLWCGPKINTSVEVSRAWMFSLCRTIKLKR